MKQRRILHTLVSLVVLASLLMGNISVTAAPAFPTDESKVPHYFGPYPNWANSPFTLPDVTVTIDPPGGTGRTAMAEAKVGANGGITSITVTDPGSGYTSVPNVTVSNASGTITSAVALANVTLTGIVAGITMATPGTGYISPTVTLVGGGAVTQATATAFGSIDQVILASPGISYTLPTVDFDMPDAPDGVQARAHVDWDATTGAITAIWLDEPGSGYSSAPKAVIRDGTLFDPINNGGSGATAIATLAISSVTVDTFGEGYTSVPDVYIDDFALSGAGATATAQVTAGGVTSIDVVAGGSGYITPGGIKKFTDQLPGLCNPAGLLGDAIPPCPATGSYIPLGVPDMSGPYQAVPDVSQTYEIALVQYRMSFSSSLPPSLVRGYVQIDTGAVPGSQHVALTNAVADPLNPGQYIEVPTGYFGVTPPQYLGPIIVTPKDQAVRIVFRNLLPTGQDGDLFLPVDTSMMGSGMGQMDEPYNPLPTVGGDVMDSVRNPMCTEKFYDPMMRAHCVTDSRATLHLHGGNSPWISDGTPHQWITPAGEATMWPEGVSVENVPDMNVCGAADDGCQTFYYTNQQSARLMFYHDHSWGITRLNVYAGEAAGYLITDATEQALMAPGGPLANLGYGGYGVPLVIQDKTFVPQAGQLAWQDPTWDTNRWGGYGNLWYHHVYMPAQNPGDPGGMSAYGRWMYGPWFWPPAGDAKYGPIANPYYTGTCNLDDPTTWDHPTDPFCEPALIPGTPNISAGMEQFNDTPIVNGVAYPTITVEPKSYRFRILSAANDRFFNLQWYVGDPNTASTDLNGLGEVIGATEVALNPAEVAAAQLDPVVFPTPDTTVSLPGPDWVQIGTEGGFLPAPVVVDGQQHTTWITDPTRFDVGNVDQHSLLLAPAERADVIVDFSQFAGKTLILYNDAPAAFPARVPSYDYYTGAPDLRPVGAPSILPGYGPNTRTIMQVKVAAAVPAPAYNLSALRAAFRHHADGSGVFESGQHPIIVGQSTYNSAYGTNFVSGGWCNSPTNPSARCDGFARISEQGGDMFKFDTLRTRWDPVTQSWTNQVSLKIEPKAIHDETNASNFDEYGRMQANLGVEVTPATPGAQNVVLHPFVYPTTEIIDASGLPSADVQVTPIATGSDGSQIWKITHNGVDTHPIHFHAFDVQLLNRVTWDNIIIPPDYTELGWKDTVRVSPLEDTIVALRPVIPVIPFDLPNSIRLLDPTKPAGMPISLSSLLQEHGLAATAFAPNGEPINLYNHYVNYGAEYVYHCHILSHEEMDMMRPVSLAFAPLAPSNLTVTAPIGTGGSRHVDLAWIDNSMDETGWEVQLATSAAGPWATVATIASDPSNPALQPSTGRSTGGVVTYSDSIVDTAEAYHYYRVRAINLVGDTWDYADPLINRIGRGGFPTVTTYSEPTNVAMVAIPPDVPTGLTAAYQAATGSPSWLPPRVLVSWTDNANNETGFSVERSLDGVNFVQIASLAAAPNKGSVSYTDAPVAGNTTYYYRVVASNVAGPSGYSNVGSVTTPDFPAPPSPVGVTCTTQGNNNARCTLTWADVVNNTSYTVQWATNATFTAGVTTPNANQQPGATATTYTTPNLSRHTAYYFRIRSNNADGSSAWENVMPFPVTTP